MKIALSCKSVLLEKTLNIFLKPYIVPFKECSFVISDTKLNTKKPVFIVNKKGHLNIPFSKNTLLLALEEFSLLINDTSSFTQLSKSNVEVKKQDIFEAKLDLLLKNFKNNLMILINEHK